MENKSKINEHLNTLESFKYYLDHIIMSIRDDIIIFNMLKI